MNNFGIWNRNSNLKFEKDNINKKSIKTSENKIFDNNINTKMIIKSDNVLIEIP